MLYRFYIFQREGLRFIFERLAGFSFRDDSFTRGQPPLVVTGQWFILSNVQFILYLLPWARISLLRWRIVGRRHHHAGRSPRHGLVVGAGRRSGRWRRSWSACCWWWWGTLGCRHAYIFEYCWECNFSLTCL